MGVFITSCEVHRRLLERERETEKETDRETERLKQTETLTEGMNGYFYYKVRGS